MASTLSASQTSVKLQLLQLLNQIPTGPDGISLGSSLIGPLDPNMQLLCMPKISNDGRHATWTKTAQTIGGEL